MNFHLHFGELHSNNSINDKNNLFENYIPKCYNVKRILISFNCFSEYSIIGVANPTSIQANERIQKILSGVRVLATFCFSHQRTLYFTECGMNLSQEAIGPLGLIASQGGRFQHF